MTDLTARFTVSGWEPREIDAVSDWADALVKRKTFTEGLVGESILLFVTSGPTDGRRAYLAAERITAATADGGTGALTVHHGGLQSDPGTLFGHIVPDSGSGAFAGWEGTARIDHDEEGAFFRFSLDDD